MKFVIDILLIAVFALLIFRGLRRGFMKSILSFGRLVLSLAITIIFGSDFSAWIDGRFINPPVFNAVSGKFSAIAADVTATANGSIDALVEKIPQAFRGYLDLESVDPAADINALADQWAHSVAAGISKVISLILGFILLFLITFLVLSVVIFIVKKLAQLPVIKTVDKILGVVVGVLSGVLVVIVLSAILGAVLGIMGQKEIVEGSLLLRLFAGVRDLIIK